MTQIVQRSPNGDIPPDLRRERTVAIETEDEIVQETDARWIKQVNNNSALVLIRTQGLALNVMAWGTSPPTALALIGICGTVTLTLNETSCKSINTQTDSGRHQAHRAVRYNTS